MADENDVAPAVAAGAAAALPPEAPRPPLRDDDDRLVPAWIEMLRVAIAGHDGAAVLDMAGRLHAADLGDVLEALDRDERLELVTMLGEAFDALAPYSLPLGWAFALWGAFLYWWAGIVYIRATARVIRLPADDTGRRSDTLDHEEVDGA